MIHIVTGKQSNRVLFLFRFVIVLTTVIVLFVSKYSSSVLPEIQEEYENFNAVEMTVKMIQYEKDVIEVHRSVFLKETIVSITVLTLLIMLTFEILIRISTGLCLKEIINGFIQDIFIVVLWIVLIAIMFTIQTQSLLSIYQ